MLTCYYPVRVTDGGECHQARALTYDDERQQTVLTGSGVAAALSVLSSLSGKCGVERGRMWS